MTISFTSVAAIAVVAALAPLAIGAARLPLPAVVLEILLGIAVGPQALGWAQVDEPVAVLSTFGLAFLLLLAGLEIDFERFRGRLLRRSSSSRCSSPVNPAVLAPSLHCCSRSWPSWSRLES